MGAINAEQVIFSALMVGKILTEDLIEIERNGLETGLKPGVPAKHLREINNALSILDSALNAEPNMSLEDEIAKLSDRVGGLEARAETTNDLLAQILSVLQTGSTPPAQDNVVPLREVESAPGDIAAKEEVTEPEPVEDTSSEVSVGDVRDAMIAYGELYGRDEMEALGARFIPEGAKPKIANIPVEKYAAVIAACAEAPQEDAA